MTRSRFPRSVFSVGDEPDARFSLANERTFLAWNRTALALIAAGVALEALGLDMHAGLRLSASALLIVSGIVLPVVAWFEWTSTERSLRTGGELSGGAAGTMMAGVVVVVGVLVGLGVLLR